MDVSANVKEKNSTFTITASLRHRLERDRAQAALKNYEKSSITNVEFANSSENSAGPAISGNDIVEKSDLLSNSAPFPIAFETFFWKKYREYLSKAKLDFIFDEFPKKRPFPPIFGTENNISQILSLSTAIPKKENINPEVGKLQNLLFTSKKELTWGCVKQGKSVSQSFFIKNQSTETIQIQCKLSNSSFKVCEANSDAVYPTLKLTLHPEKITKMVVIFSPRTIGAAIDYLDFKLTDPLYQQSGRQTINLTGYEGFENIVLQNLAKDTNGKFWISFGNVKRIEKSFTVKNCGNLPSFVYFNFDNTSVEICPSVVVLIPEEKKEVLFKYTLREKDNYMIKSTLNTKVEIGRVKVIRGTEVDRARLRKVCQNSSDKSTNIILNLIDKFPEEIIPNLGQFKESSSAISELLKFFRNDEIIITYEQKNETLFQSLCQNDTILHSTTRKKCQIEPSLIILFPAKTKDTIFLTNYDKRLIYFEVHSSDNNLQISTNQGTVNPNQIMKIEVKYGQKCKANKFKVRILVDNECFIVDVKVIFV